MSLEKKKLINDYIDKTIEKAIEEALKSKKEEKDNTWNLPNENKDG